MGGGQYGNWSVSFFSKYEKGIVSSHTRERSTLEKTDRSSDWLPGRDFLTKYYSLYICHNFFAQVTIKLIS
jgi:hypothetical protein